MDEDKKAKLLLMTDKIIDINDLKICNVNTVHADKADVLMFEPDDYFLTPKEQREEQLIKIDMEIRFYGKLKDLKHIYNSKILKVVPFDESGNIIDQS